MAKATTLRAVCVGAALSLTLVFPRTTQAEPPTASPKKNRTTTPKKNAPSAPADRHATRGQYLAHTALSYRGLPYRWGGTSPRSGFDCSGMVQYVCAKWGIYLPRAGSEQYRQGVSVKQQDLQAGDLVFFKNTYKRGISHVGIYVGDGLFMHAAGRKLGVMLSRLDKGYHKAHWAGARRLNLSKLPPVPDEASVTPDHVVLEDAPNANGDLPAGDNQ